VPGSVRCQVSAGTSAWNRAGCPAVSGAERLDGAVCVRFRRRCRPAGARGPLAVPQPDPRRRRPRARRTPRRLQRKWISVAVGRVPGSGLHRRPGRPRSDEPSAFRIAAPMPSSAPGPAPHGPACSTPPSDTWSDRGRSDAGPDQRTSPPSSVAATRPAPSVARFSIGLPHRLSGDVDEGQVGSDPTCKLSDAVGSGGHASAIAPPRSAARTAGTRGRPRRSPACGRCRTGAATSASRSSEGEDASESVPTATRLPS